MFHMHKPVEIERTIGSFRKGGIQFEYRMPIIRYKCKKCKMVCETLDWELLGIRKCDNKVWYREEA